MFLINEDQSIYITRGDTAVFQITANKGESERYTFQVGEVVRIKVFEKKACENVVLQKDFTIEEETEAVGIYLEESDTKIGEVISKPKDYWYEVELNPDSNPHTIIGYDDDGAKIFRLFPEGADIEEMPVDEGSAFEKVIKDTVEGWLEGSFSDEVISEQVEQYLEKNPIKLGATKEQIEQNKTDISKLSAMKVDHPSTGKVGQILEIETIDENGKPKTYKAVDKPTGGSSVVSKGGTTDINLKKWYGKKIVVDGSSITTGGTGLTQPTWSDFLKDMFALSTVYNHAGSGTGWFTGNPTAMERVEEYEEDADAIIMMGDYNGVYNYTKGTGSIDDEPSLDGGTYACLKYLAETLINKFPLCPVIWVIEPPRSTSDGGMLPMSYDSEYNKYSKIIEEVAELYGFPHCNLMKNTVFRPWIQANYDETTSDGTHPWNNVQRTMAQVIAETMKRTPLFYNESYVVTPDTSGGEDSGDSEGGTEDTTKELTSIKVSKVNGYTLYEGDNLAKVKECIIVKATYSDLSESQVSNYTVTGELVSGTQTFTIEYGGLTTSVDLTVTEGNRPVVYNFTDLNPKMDYYLSKVGTEQVNAGYGFYTQDYVPVEEGGVLTFSTRPASYEYAIYYDDEYNHVSSSGNTYGTASYTVPSGVHYARFNGYEVNAVESYTVSYVTPFN